MSNDGLMHGLAERGNQAPADISFEEAVDLVGARPGKENREDLIVRWGFTAMHWRWCRDIGKTLPEAIAIHRGLGDEFTVVRDRVLKESKKKRRLAGEQTLVPQDQIPAVPAELESKRQNRDSEPSIAEAPADDAAPQDAIEAKNQEGANPETLEGLKANVASDPAKSPAQRPAREAANLIPPRKDYTAWLDDRITAGFAISSVLMLVPIAVGLYLAPQTLAPRFFLAAQVGFIFGTIGGLFTRRRRGRRQARVAQDATGDAKPTNDTSTTSS